MKDTVIPMVRQAISVTLPKICVEWVDKQVEARIYHNRSHAIEVLILKEMKGTQ